MDQAQATAAELQRAAQGVVELTAEVVEEVAGILRPPPLLGQVLEAVCLLKGEQYEWDSARRMLGELDTGFSAQVATDFLRSVENFDVAAVDANVIQQVREITAQQNFSPEAAGRVSLLGGKLCAWVVAVVAYHEANCAVGGA